MPRMSGIEFLEKLRLLKFGERAQVIFCSAEGGIKHIQRALDAGANEYIVKPFDREVIKSKFSKLGLVKR